jgi:hypothetical protein
VSLDTDKLHRLKGKKFDELYETHKKQWDDMVIGAAEYVKRYLEKTGETVRPADISAILQNPIRVDPDFEAFVTRNASIRNTGWSGSPTTSWSRSTRCQKSNRERYALMAEDLHSLAEQFIRDQLAIIKKYGKQPKLDEERYDKIVRDTERTFKRMRRAKPRAKAAVG